MNNLQKDSPGSQLLQQFLCQAVTATARVSNRRLARAFCKVYGSDSLTARTDDNFVAPNVSQSASLSYRSSRGLGHYSNVSLVSGNPSAQVASFSAAARPICTQGPAWLTWASAICAMVAGRRLIFAQICLKSLYRKR